MKIFIISMDDPIQTNQFIKKILDVRKKDIIGLAVSKGDRLRIGEKRSKVIYVFSLLLIMGFPMFIKDSVITVLFKLRKKLAKSGIGKNPSILSYAQNLGIRTFEINTPNSRSFREELSALEPDIIINQSQSLIKKELLDIPSIGIINRHNALLPHNRGRLSPFWVAYRKEKQTGVSIHFLDEGIDSGDIIVQERIEVLEKDTFNSIVKKNYSIASGAMLKALEILEKGNYKLIPNEDEKATYNSVPTFKEALIYRLNRMRW